MTRIRVRDTHEVEDAWQRPMNEAMYPGEWETSTAIYTPGEVTLVGRHAGEYDPEHWGEKDPDAYDRMGYAVGMYGWEARIGGFHGRHLLDTGVN